MKRAQMKILIALMILFMFGCPPKTEPTPELPPPEPADTASEVTDSVTPQVDVDPEPESIPTIDINNIRLEDVYFDFDKADLRSDAREVLERHAMVLNANANVSILIEGHCDERGTEEYNMALGERRAERVKSFLTSLGIAPNRLRTISYGELRPAVDRSDEQAWSQNRRGHFVLSLMD